MPKAKSQKSTTAKENGNSSVRVRMYRVGFGDCFLLTLGGKHHILVDCGVHAKGNVKANGESLIDKAFADIAEVTQKKLDVVIATHAHQDHVSGFGKFAEQFAEFTVGEVWMPWTDDPSNAIARKWHQKKAAMVSLMRSRFAATMHPEAVAAADNAEPNATAMKALRAGFGTGKVRYLKAGDKIDKPSEIAGLSAEILGPPQDQSFFTQMDPPASDHYLRMVNEAGAGGSTKPFPKWELKTSQLPAEWPQLDLKRIEKLKEQAEFQADAAAFSLDKVLNNTSVVALFNWHGKQLLFPGDAEYGDWSSWYKKRGSEVLSNICFYKVSHHGSFNATPKGALSEMPQDGFAAMLSTQNKPWDSIPRKPLLAALEKRTGGKVARADCVNITGAPNCSTKLPNVFTTGNKSQGEFWIDYEIK